MGWTGFHAFHRVGDRDLTVVVAASRAETLASVDRLAAEAWWLGGVATGLVVVIGGLLWREISTVRASRRQRDLFQRNRTELERLRLDVGTIVSRSHLDADRVRVLVDAVSDGVALFDLDDRLVQSNAAFRYYIGVDPQRVMTLDALLREQVERGMFGLGGGAESEIARRVGVLRSGDADGLAHVVEALGAWVLRGLPLADGG